MLPSPALPQQLSYLRKQERSRGRAWREALREGKAMEQA